MQNTAVPRISVSLDDGPAGSNSDLGLLSLSEALTDIEDFDSDTEQSSVTPDAKRKSNLIFTGVGGDGIILTDTEYMDGSDDDEEDRFPRAATPLDNLLEFEGTFEELLEVTSNYKGKNRGAEVSKVSNTPGGFLGIPDDGREGFTDYEDFALSDDDWIEEDLVMDDVDLDDHIPDDGVVDISDRVKRCDECPSPAATPEPGHMPKDDLSRFSPDVFLKPKPLQKSKKGQGNRKQSQTKKKTKSQFLSPKPASSQVNDVTDTEVLPSDSEDDGQDKRTVRRRKRGQNVRNVEGGVTDMEELDMSGDEAYHVKDVDKMSGLPKATRSVVHISDKPSRSFIEPDGHTDDEDMMLSDREEAKPVPSRRIKYKASKSSTGLLVPDAGMDALTDVEDLDGPDEGSDEDFVPRAPSPLVSPLKEMETHYGSVTVSYSTKERERDPDAEQTDHGITDYEDFTADDKEDIFTAQKRKRAVLKYMKKKSRQTSTDEDDVEGSDGEFKKGDRGDDVSVQQDVYEIRFMELEGEARPVIVAPGGKIPMKGKNKGQFLDVIATEGGVTDVEDVGHTSASSESDDEEIKPGKSTLNMQPKRRGSVTDVEDFEGDDDDASADLSDGEKDHVLPDAVREMTLVQYQHDGRPVVVTLPLSDDHRLGLMVPKETKHVLTDVEDFDVDEQEAAAVDELEARPPTPEIQMDFGIIDASEGIKYERKSRLQSVSHAPLTDTEDIYFEGEPNRRKRTKSKGKLLLAPKVVQRSGGTDVEELDVSDAEALAADGIAVVRRPMLSVTPVNMEGKTDIEDMSDGDDGDDYPPSRRPMSVTPDIMRNMECSTLIFTEGVGRFPSSVHRMTLDPTRNLPTILMSSPTPDINCQELTDTEDMQASADEDVPYSRADTAEPLEVVGIEDGSSTVVHVKHTRKRDYDAAEEAINMRGFSLRETHTDVEDLVSEDEPRVEDCISVDESAAGVCVCVAGGERDAASVCVCVGRERGDLSMVWKSGNTSTSATSSHPPAGNATRDGEDWSDKSQAKDGVQSLGAEGLVLPDGAAGAQGGSTVTTTETRVVEGSEDMQELLAKLSAEHRK